MTKGILVELFDKGKNFMYFLLQFSRVKNTHFIITISALTGIRVEAIEIVGDKTYHYQLSQNGDVIKYEEICSPNIKH